MYVILYLTTSFKTLDAKICPYTSESFPASSSEAALAKLAVALSAQNI